MSPFNYQKPLHVEASGSELACLKNRVSTQCVTRFCESVDVQIQPSPNCL